jgi:hypothetical protein
MKKSIIREKLDRVEIRVSGSREIRQGFVEKAIGFIQLLGFFGRTGLKEVGLASGEMGQLIRRIDLDGLSRISQSHVVKKHPLPVQVSPSPLGIGFDGSRVQLDRFAVISDGPGVISSPQVYVSAFDLALGLALLPWGRGPVGG